MKLAKDVEDVLDLERRQIDLERRDVQILRAQCTFAQAQLGLR